LTAAAKGLAARVIERGKKKPAQAMCPRGFLL
jgi:hypothetical protein